MSIPPQPGFMDRHGRWMVAAAVALALGGIGYRLWRGAPGGDDWRGDSLESPGPTAVETAQGPGADARPGPAATRNAEPRTRNPVRAEQPPPRPTTAEEQTAAIREAVVRDTIQTIRLAALRGDEATIKGLVPGLKFQRQATRKLIEDGLLHEDDTSIRLALEGVLREIE